MSPEVKAALELIMKATAGAPSVAPGLTLERLWDLYQAANGTRLRSLSTDLGRVKHLLRVFGADRDVATLTLEDVDAYRAQRRGEITVRKGAPSPATRNREVELLARVLSFAVSRRLLAANPLASVEYEPEDNVRQVVVKDDLLERILGACDAWLRAFVLVAIDSGCRRTELVKLRWSQVDEERGLIHLAAVDTKTRQARTTILSNRARQALAVLPKSDHWVFVNPRSGDRYDPGYVSQKFRLTMMDAGITGPDGRRIWIHDLRRTFATNSRRTGIPETVVMTMTGHRTASVFERYNIKGLEDVLQARQTLETAHRVGNPMIRAGEVA